MFKNHNDKIYSNYHFSFLEKISFKKRKEITKLIKNFLIEKEIEDVLDVGTTRDDKNVGSNYIVKNIGSYRIYKSISDQSINSDFFTCKR